VQEHAFSVELPAPPSEVWDIFWYRGPDRPQPPPGSGTRIEILHPGDAVGEGLVRHCHFPVPKILGSGGPDLNGVMSHPASLHRPPPVS
jgi:hypothetical protein